MDVGACEATVRQKVPGSSATLCLAVGDRGVVRHSCHPNHLRRVRATLYPRRAAVRISCDRWCSEATLAQCGRRSHRHTGRRPKLADTPRHRSQTDKSRPRRGALWSCSRPGSASSERIAERARNSPDQWRRSVPPQLSGMSSRRRHGRAAGNSLTARGRSGFVIGVGARATATTNR